MNEWHVFDLDVRIYSYIGHPYWPEREKLINIVKESGMSRARSSANRRKALEEYLRSANMTFAAYEELQARADEPFHRAGNFILIPELHVISMIVAACDTIRAAGRPVQPDQVRSALRVSGWVTDRKEPDGLWERFAVVTAGTGAKLSNQRALRTNPYIGFPPGAEPESEEDAVQAEGTIRLNPSMVKPQVMLDALRWAGANIGIGASRKMGWGRFSILNMTQRI